MNKSFGSHFLAVGSLTAAAEPAVSRVPGRELVRATTLANGLKIVVWPVHDIPSIALNNWVRAGSRNEAPGITGLAQVNGMRGETETLEKMSERVRYDLEYLRFWSPWLDLKIIFKTLSLVLRGGKHVY